MKYIIYTDGSCVKGAGGWASIIIDENNKEVVLVGSEYGTTNNRMELLAPIRALEHISNSNSKNDVILYSDSLYFVNSFNKNWIDHYKPGRVNYDLWAKLKELIKLNNIKLIWVKGHSHNPLNNRVDRLSRRAATKLKRQVGNEPIPIIRFSDLEPKNLTPEEEFELEKKRLLNWGKKPIDQSFGKQKIRKKKKRVITEDTKVLLVIKRSNSPHPSPALVYDFEGTRYIDWFNRTSMRKSHCKIIKENATKEDYLEFKKQFENDEK